MTVEIKNLKTGNIITRNDVTEIIIKDEYIRIKLNKRIRNGEIAGMRFEGDMYEIVSIIR